MGTCACLIFPACDADSHIIEAWFKKRCSNCAGTEDLSSPASYPVKPVRIRKSRLGSCAVRGRGLGEIRAAEMPLGERNKHHIVPSYECPEGHAAPDLSSSTCSERAPAVKQRSSLPRRRARFLGFDAAICAEAPSHSILGWRVECWRSERAIQKRSRRGSEIGFTQATRRKRRVPLDSRCHGKLTKITFMSPLRAPNHAAPTHLARNPLLFCFQIRGFRTRTFQFPKQRLTECRAVFDWPICSF